MNFLKTTLTTGLMMATVLFGANTPAQAQTTNGKTTYHNYEFGPYGMNSGNYQLGSGDTFFIGCFN